MRGVLLWQLPIVMLCMLELVVVIEVGLQCYAQQVAFFEILYLLESQNAYFFKVAAIVLGKLVRRIGPRREFGESNSQIV